LESLALVVTIILFGLLFIGLVGPVLAIFYRKRKIGKYWIVGFLILLGGLTLLAWQGSPVLGAIPLIGLAITAAIAYWPKANK
jgi:drug/metabolite transporter (DMT)-like permease